MDTFSYRALESENFARALHNSYFYQEDGFFFSSKAPGLVFSAPFYHSLQKSAPPLPGWRRLSCFAKVSQLSASVL